jgi:hypothetical protein
MQVFSYVFADKYCLLTNFIRTLATISNNFNKSEDALPLQHILATYIL